MRTPSEPSVDEGVDASADPAAQRSPPQSGLSAIQTAVDEAGALGFVHVGKRFDPMRRYLTRVDGPDRESAIVFLPGSDGREPQAVYCVPNDSLSVAADFEQAVDSNSIRRWVAGRSPATATGQQVCSLLADQLGDSAATGSLLVPRDLPHDTAVFLQQAGYELRSTATLTTARATKTPEERDCLRAVQSAATAGMARAEAVVAACETTTEGLVADGRPLTAERVRRQINAELAAAGVDPAANTVVAADTGSTGHLPAGEPIRLTVRPRGPHGYHGTLRRTVVVDSDGGWERRAFIAAEAGLQAALRELDVGVDVSVVEGEAVAEVGAYGFAVAPDAESRRARATASVHGVGLSTHEPPAVGPNSQLRDGAVLAVETGVVDPSRGAVRLGTLVAVSADDTETLVEYPASLRPVDRLESLDD